MNILIGSIWSHWLGKSLQNVEVVTVTDTAVYIKWGMTTHCIDKQTFIEAYREVTPCTK